MKFQSILSTATSTLAVGAAFLAVPAFAQSTGAVDFEEGAIVVTGQTQNGVAGVKLPNTSKAKQVLTQEIIQTQVPGQTINDVINLMPGVSFQNNDAFGSGGGTLTIRGFDDSRISQTVDGIPLNDTGGYALYSNQQIDPEIIEQVNVNLGTTDVDSPTAAASGSTVNIRTRNPFDDFGVRFLGSAGDFGFFRMFGEIDTGVLNSSGTKAFFSASKAVNNTVYGGIGEIDKTQFNAKIYQPIGDNGDFISVAGHWNRNRNNFFGSTPLRTDPTRVVGPDSSNRFPLTKKERFYKIADCQIPAGVTGVADPASSCGSLYDFRYNPSDTGNIRINSRFTLSDKLTLNVDPSIQYTKANGGGTVDAREFGYERGVAAPISGYIGGKPYFNGVDLNGDGDTQDTVRILAPSNTETWRIGVIASLRYDINDFNRVRVAYSYDRGRHRQTGETSLLKSNGFGSDVFSDNALADADGNILQKRDRLSYAILHQVSGEYTGDFMNDRVHLNLGVRAPFFKRNLTNNCLASSSGGFVDCFTTNTADQAAYAAANPTYKLPQQRILNYNKVLPTAGVVFDATDSASLFFNYSKGVQVPGTDNLYQSFWYARDQDAANPVPETTDNFDLGVRYSSGIIQASLTGWYTRYSNRLASAFDRELDVTIYRNLGRVDKYGIDGSFAVQPIPEFSLYVFGSYLKSKIKENVEIDTDASGNPVYAITKGKREAGAPVYTLGTRAQGTLGPVELGVQVKRTGPRYVNDQNLPILSGTTQIYGKKTPAYTLVDLDAKVKLDFIGLGDRTFLQLNVVNLFDKLYVGGFDGAGTSQTNVPNAFIGTPRTFIGSVSFGF
ncbi:TonB-dependent receptor [Novosphingobium lindaniclasticum]|uniref:TonB-denpendent receptor n=1 Tax=Novosphingobium lindaniclasticum LE124 TaxID=1096930 RepID=T0HA99_9SPHN|nr:TonB-dependent receptor [Novosphingobium lindaniclasticum]EQB09927.1 TonB-denpendent receptor [Novosphingobium lindaniclasticum LE124]